MSCGGVPDMILKWLLWAVLAVIIVVGLIIGACNYWG